MSTSDFKSDISAELANAAYQGTSFSPERRGESARAEYEAHLQEAYQRLKAQAEKGGTGDLLEEAFAIYRAGLKRRYSAYLASSSRCVSSMIAGPSNFPVRQMQKRSDSAHKKLGEYLDFSSKALERAIRRLRPDLAPIRSEDSDALDRLREKLAKLEADHAGYKSINEAIRKNAKNGLEAQRSALMGLGLAGRTIEEALKPQYGRPGIPAWALSNNLANIKRIKARIAAVSQKKSTETKSAEASSGLRLEECPAENRVKLFFPNKPDEQMRKRLKSNGFRWAPSEQSWKAYYNARSLAFAAQILKEAA